MDFDIPDERSTAQADYEKLHKRTRFETSWDIGVARQTDGNQTVSFDRGLTWGSIGQILGYLLGDADKATKDDLYDKLLMQYKKTDRGQSIK